MELMHQLTPKLKQLRLSGVLETLDARHRQAVEGQWTHVEFLSRLLEDEVERRRAEAAGLARAAGDGQHGQDAGELRLQLQSLRQAQPDPAAGERRLHPPEAQRSPVRPDRGRQKSSGAGLGAQGDPARL